MDFRCFFGPALALFLIAPAHADGRDGQLFDQGTGMSAPAERASEETSRVAFLRGSWDVRHTQFHEGVEAHSSVAAAATTFMNRGHGYLERFVCEDFDGKGNPRHSVSFLVQVPSTGQWNLGIADSWSESITLYSGGFAGEKLILETIDRRGGSGPLVHRRMILTPEGPDSFNLRAESGVFGADLAPVWSRSYARRPDRPAQLAGEGYGKAAPDLPEEAHQFDFLLGEWDESHEMSFPNGQTAKWSANGTAVRILGGHAIMEHGWFDADPNLPDAATTIVRIYNRAMRRWESMFCSNRFNNILHFGGVKEGDRIVLHSFDHDTAAPQFSYWIFHSMEEDSYGWYANTSRDRGQSFQKSWIIEGSRKVGSR